MTLEARRPKRTTCREVLGLVVNGEFRAARHYTRNPEGYFHVRTHKRRELLVGGGLPERPDARGIGERYGFRAGDVTGLRRVELPAVFRCASCGWSSEVPERLAAVSE